VPRPAAFSLMHLLYLDDSGAVQNPADRHVILAGLAVFERKPHWLAKSLDDLAEKIWPDNPQSLEFRGTDILSGKRHWRGVPKPDRIHIYDKALSILGESNHVRLFGASIHKASLSPEDPMEYAFEQICNRFDRFLGRLHKKGDTQRGLIILDKSSYETSLQILATEFRNTGHKWGQLYNLSDVPLFVDSRATRLIQFADLVAHSLFRYHEKGDTQFFDIIKKPYPFTSGATRYGVTAGVGWCRT